MNATESPNILLIVVDCLRADFAYESDLAVTPTLDALRSEGFSFVNAIASAATTTPCVASLLTGLYPFEHGVRSHSGYRVADGVVALPLLLSRAGYHTRAEVSGPLGPEVGLDRGFDEYFFRSRDQHIHTSWGEGLLQRMQELPARPWFVLLHLWSLHKSRKVLPECDNDGCARTHYGRALASTDRYLARLLEVVPPNTLIVLTGDHGEDIAWGRFDRFQKKLRKKWHRYRVTRRLTRRHVALLYRGCHIGHGHGLHDALVRVPLILHLPGTVPHGWSELQVRHIDIAPTILELAGLPLPDMTGRSLMGITKGQEDVHRTAYLEAVGRVIPDPSQWLAGMREANRYKYICAPHRDDFRPQLFDLAADPEERSNIARRRPDVAARLRAAIEALPTQSMRGGLMDAEERGRVTARLRDLGYLDD